MPSVRKKRAQNKQNYLRNKENRKEAARTKYWENPDKQRARCRASYWENPDKGRASSRAHYWEDPEKGRTASRISSRSSYWRNPGKKRAAGRVANLKAARAKLKWYRRYYAKHGKGICAFRRSRYALAEPNGSVIEVHVKKIQHQLLANAGAKLELLRSTPRLQQNNCPKAWSKLCV